MGGVIPPQTGLCYENDCIFITICSWDSSISRLFMGYQIQKTDTYDILKFFKMISIYSLESHTKILVFFLLQLCEKPQQLFMLKVIQFIFRGYILYKMVIIKSRRIASMVIILRVICPQNQVFFYLFFSKC